MQKTVISFILFTILIISACDYITDLKRTGEEITMEIPWNGSGQIEVNASSSIVLVNSEDYKIKITGMDFIARGYEIDTSDNKLNITHTNPFRLQQDKLPDILIYSPDFRRLTINAPSRLANRDSLKFENLYISINGRGTYTTSQLKLKGNLFRFNVYGRGTKTTHQLTGVANKAYYHIEGGTNINASDLKTGTTNIRHLSFGNCFVNSTETLDVTIFSSGNVYYSGNPEVQFKQDETSTLRPSGIVVQVTE
ncbi:GIN domain-containing protein [Natronoflexus pectinivorans]|uniref:Putative autotransporter adhesin-like protein n=1 Tax=Natronoflexus pectinivorans TaxID=682526 RepID=A0A4R2G9Y0_9BACT|nr:DUF2807 domain-containing protein [Natronoflexus pectinivorans]TCO04451.1 putative autotransporter adhesin-like protein [Natronoflexus pectinivorans]